MTPRHTPTVTLSTYEASSGSRGLVIVAPIRLYPFYSASSDADPTNSPQFGHRIVLVGHYCVIIQESGSLGSARAS